MERFAPEHLLKAARILGVNPSFFFNGLRGEEISEVERFRAEAFAANDNAFRCVWTPAFIDRPRPEPELCS